MSLYGHGIYTGEAPTSLLPPRKVEAAIPVAIGTAPGPKDGDIPVNKIVLCFTYESFVSQLGYSEEWNKFTLCEFATAWFNDYRVAPAIFINVYDPEVHKSGENPDPLAVTSADIIGGVGDDLTKKGLELVDSVFSQTRLVPGQIVAPGWSNVPVVALSMATHAKTIDAGIFSCHAVIDISSAVTKYTELGSYKENNSLTSPYMILCWPKVKRGDKIYHMSSHYAAKCAVVDNESGDIPYRSASNQRAEITGVDNGGKELFLNLEEANYLNGQGIVTVINWDGGWKFWGNRTAAYPSNTDPKDSFIPIRRFYNWYKNRFVLRYFQKIDYPLTRRILETIIDSEQVELNSWASQEVILGGRIILQESENPVTDLMDGKVVFHTYITPPSPAKEIHNILEYDPDYVKRLFG